MNILYIACEFPPCSGGISVFSSNLLDQLLKRGHIVFLCVPNGSMIMPHKNLRKVVYYNSDRHVMKQFSLIFLKQMATCSIDIVFFTQFLGSSWMGILLLSKITRIPAVALCHGWELHYLKWHPIDNIGLRIGIKTLKLGLANSNFCKNVILHEGMKRAKLVVLNPGTNINNTNVLKRKYKFPNSAIMLLTVCRIEQLKGIDLVIEAMNKLKDIYPQLVYIVCGNIAKWGQSYYASLLSKVEQYDLGKRVSFIGYIPADNIGSIYEQADIYVSPSRVEKIKSSFRAESFGITYLEAATACLPVIATKTGGIADAVEDGVTGILIENENVEELTAAIKYLIDNTIVAAEMGRKGKERVEKYFTWDKVGQRLEHYLESVLGDK